MPKRTRKDSEGTHQKKEKDNLRLRVASNGHRLPDPIPKGEVLTDVTVHKWRLGKSIGLGGFGEIYLASDCISKGVGLDAPYVIKVEDHNNGPLFAEMHFYHRVGKAALINEWMQKKKLHFLGMPKFIGSGSHYYKGIKYRFMVLERFGEDLQKLLEKNNRIFPLKTVYTLGIKILDILEYIHSFGYIHADVKASNLLSGYGKTKQNEVHLVDFGLACKYITDGKHKEFKEDLRKAHDGTIEFTSRDAHIGAHSRRGDLEILGYNMLQWLSGHLPWEENLKDPEVVSQQKIMYMSNIPLLMQKCFPNGSHPKGIAEYLQYVKILNFDDEPDYDLLRRILREGLRASGYKDDGKLVYTNQGNLLARKGSISKNMKRPAIKNNVDVLIPSRGKKRLLQKMPSADAGRSSPHLKVRRVASAAPGLQSSGSKTSNSEIRDSSLDNPTPAMLMVMQRRLQLQRQQQQEEQTKNKVLNCKNSHKETAKIKAKSVLVPCSLSKRNHKSSKSKKVNNKSRKKVLTPVLTNATHKNSYSFQL